MNIAYLILAHQHPGLLARLIRRLFKAGGIVAVHFDRNAGDAPVKELRELMGSDFDRIIWVNRVPVVWGEWSLVKATLNGLEAIAETEHYPDYVYLLSGSDYPTRPLGELKEFLGRNKGKEFIESFSDRVHDWVTRGIQTERYHYRFPFNWGKNPRLFSLALRLQKVLRWKRRVPAGVDPHFGSQWWVLTWTSCVSILKLCENREMLRFFQGAWVPDELFFQTNIRKVAEPENICSHTLTLYQFTDAGTPVIYCNGHEEYLARQNFFFARKISPWAEQIRNKLDAISQSEREQYQVADKDIGKRTPEYEDHCRIYGYGVLGKQVIGQVTNEMLGDLSWNRKPYFVVAGFSFQEIKAVQDYLNSLEGIICHGQLFHPKHIDFYDYAERYAGFSRQDVPLRNNNIQSFLVQLLQEGDDRKVGFLVNLTTQESVIHRLVCDPNARVIVLDGDPVHAFLESDGISNIQVGADDQAHAGILDEQERILSLLVWHYESCRRKLDDLKCRLVKCNTCVLYLQTSVESAGTTLTARHLGDFYHNRLTDYPQEGKTGQYLQFSTGLEKPAGFDSFQMVRS